MSPKDIFEVAKSCLKSNNTNQNMKKQKQKRQNIVTTCIKHVLFVCLIFLLLPAPHPEVGGRIFAKEFLAKRPDWFEIFPWLFAGCDGALFNSLQLLDTLAASIADDIREVSTESRSENTFRNSQVIVPPIIGQMHIGSAETPHPEVGFKVLRFDLR